MNNNNPILVKHEGGRPKKQLKDLPAGWKDTIIEIMRVGGSLDEIKALLNISNDLYERFMDEEPEFSETVKRGKQLSKAWWMAEGRNNLHSKTFSPVLWYMNMKNRFGWADRQETNINIQVPTSITIPQEDKIIKLLPPKKVLELDE
jgi:hypothetical protein